MKDHNVSIPHDGNEKADVFWKRPKDRSVETLIGENSSLVAWEHVLHGTVVVL